MIDAQIIRQWWDIFRKDANLTEVRILNKGKGSKTYSGYFKDVENLIQCLRGYESMGIYSTLNDVKDSCYGRKQHEQIIDNMGATTNDSDIDHRMYILIDFDPKRPSDTNSTDNEKKLAQKVVNRVFAFLRDEGFPHPVIADSANGYHLYYKVAMKNSEENTQLISKFLKVLNMMFSNEFVDIDTSVANAGRICKIIGTSSNKGADTEDRPQRMSTFIRVPDEFCVTDIEFIRKVANLMPEEEKPTKFNGYSTDKFDVEEFLSQHGINVIHKTHFVGGTKLVLERCPFDSNHHAPDSAVFVLDNGAIGFRCLHNSCSRYTWHDVRVMLDPNAYDRKETESLQQRQAYYNTNHTPTIVQKEDSSKGKKWLSMDDINFVDPSQLPFIPTGIEMLDRKIMGFMAGDVTVLSGLSGAGKTSIIDFITLNAVQRGHKVAIWSGELQDFRFQAWIDQMAAGKNYVEKKPGYDNLYYAPIKVCHKINKWLNGKLWLYNNNYGAKWTQLFSDIKECVETLGVEMIFVDNLMSLSLDTYNGDKNEKQTQFINDLKTYAKQKNIHIVLVCHPRKEVSNQLLRMESISGTADLTNLADNVLIVHRVGRDFEKRAKDFYGEETTSLYATFDEVIEICKNRSVGIKDEIIGLYYEVESRRFKNSVAEHIVYGWQDEPVQMSMDMPRLGDYMPTL